MLLAVVLLGAAIGLLAVAEAGEAERRQDLLRRLNEANRECNRLDGELRAAVAGDGELPDGGRRECVRPALVPDPPEPPATS